MSEIEKQSNYRDVTPISSAPSFGESYLGSSGKSDQQVEEPLINAVPELCIVPDIDKQQVERIGNKIARLAILITAGAATSYVFRKLRK